MPRTAQKLVGAATVLLAALIGAGATQLPGAEAYSGVGSNFLPALVAVVLLVCGVLLLKEAFSGGGFAKLPDDLTSLPPPNWRGMAWLSAGLLVNAATITTVGFIPSCTVLFVLAARGFRVSMGAGKAPLREVLRDTAIGAAISAPVYWLFTKLLGLNLPGLTGTGWL